MSVRGEAVQVDWADTDHVLYMTITIFPPAGTLVPVVKEVSYVKALELGDCRLIAVFEIEMLLKSLVAAVKPNVYQSIFDYPAPQAPPPGPILNPLVLSAAAEFE